MELITLNSKNKKAAKLIRAKLKDIPDVEELPSDSETLELLAAIQRGEEAILKGEVLTPNELEEEMTRAKEEIMNSRKK